MEKLHAQLAQAEEELGDSGLYDQSRKAKPTVCLQQQASAKSGLEECEMAWLEAQEQLEQMSAEQSPLPDPTPTRLIRHLCRVIPVSPDASRFLRNARGQTAYH